ncbi:MAG: hypothetical protein ACOCQY_05075 [Halorhabdus sp.]
MSEVVTADWQSDPITFGAQGLYATFGGGTPREQMVWSVIASIGAYISTALSLGATAILVVLFAVTFFIGVARLLWQQLRG